jgi:hypothetical protein
VIILQTNSTHKGKSKMAQHVKVKPSTDKMLTELSEKRKGEEAFIKSKQDIAAEAIEILYKKEIKRG